MLDIHEVIMYTEAVKRGNTLATQNRIAHPKGWNMTNVDNVS